MYFSVLWSVLRSIQHTTKTLIIAYRFKSCTTHPRSITINHYNNWRPRHPTPQQIMLSLHTNEIMSYVPSLQSPIKWIWIFSQNYVNISLIPPDSLILPTGTPPANQSNPANFICIHYHCPTIPRCDLVAPLYIPWTIPPLFCSETLHLYHLPSVLYIHLL